MNANVDRNKSNTVGGYRVVVVDEIAVLVGFRVELLLSCHRIRIRVLWSRSRCALRLKLDRTGIRFAVIRWSTRISRLLNCRKLVSVVILDDSRV